jgi:hypothetical protein
MNSSHISEPEKQKHRLHTGAKENQYPGMFSRKSFMAVSGPTAV